MLCRGVCSLYACGVCSLYACGVCLVSCGVCLGV